MTKLHGAVVGPRMRVVIHGYWLAASVVFLWIIARLVT